MPNDDPERLRARVRMHYPVRADRIIGLGELPGLRLQRAFARHEGEPLRAVEQALVWCHWLWFGVPHGTVAYLLARRRELFPRGATQIYAVFDLGLIGYWALPTAPPWYAAEEGALGPREPEHAPADARARTGGLEGRLGASLRCPGRQPSRRHALPALRHLRDGRPRPQRRRAGAGRAWVVLRPHARVRARLSGRALRHRSPRRAGAGRGRAPPAATVPRRRCVRRAGRSSSSRRGRTHEFGARRRAQRHSTAGRRRRGDAARGHHARAGPGLRRLRGRVDRLSVLRPAEDLRWDLGVDPQPRRRQARVADRGVLLRVPVLLRLRDPLPHGLRPRQDPDRLARELRDHDGRRGCHAPVRGRRRGRRRAHRVGAAALGDGAPGGGLPHGRLPLAALRGVHGRDRGLRARALLRHLQRARAVRDHRRAGDLRPAC